MTDSPAPLVAIIVVAAGSGTRLGHELPKAFVPLAGRTLLERAVESAFGMREAAQVIVVAPEDRLDEARALAAGREGTCLVQAVFRGDDDYLGGLAHPEGGFDGALEEGASGERHEGLGQLVPEPGSTARGDDDDRDQRRRGISHVRRLSGEVVRVKSGLARASPGATRKAAPFGAAFQRNGGLGRKNLVENA